MYRGGYMAYLKTDSTPAQQEVQARVACQIIAARSKIKSKEDRKSYSITSRDSCETSMDLPFFKERKFGRG